MLKEEYPFSPIMVHLSRVGGVGTRGTSPEIKSRNVTMQGGNNTTNLSKPITSRLSDTQNASISANTSAIEHGSTTPMTPPEKDGLNSQPIELFIDRPIPSPDDKSSGETSNLQVCTPVLQSQMFVNTTCRHIFKYPMPKNIEGLFRLGLLTVAGREPP